MSEMKRFNVRLNENLYEWYKKESEEIGIPMHSLIIMALMQYQRTETVLPNLPGFVKQIVDFAANDGEKEE